MGNQIRNTGADYRLLFNLRAQGALDDVRGHRVPLKDGAAVFACADKDQFFDMYLHLIRRLFSGIFVAVLRWLFLGEVPKIHVLTGHGGAIPLSHLWPTSEEGIVLQREAIQAHELKGITTFILYAHVPCGAARIHGFGVKGVIDMLMEAKRTIKSLNPAFKVACFVHVDWGERRFLFFRWRRRRTYFISRHRWETFCGQIPVVTVEDQAAA